MVAILDFALFTDRLVLSMAPTCYLECSFWQAMLHQSCIIPQLCNPINPDQVMLDTRGWMTILSGINTEWQHLLYQQGFILTLSAV